MWADVLEFEEYGWKKSTLWCQLEDMFQLVGTSQGIERVLFQIIVTPEYIEKYRVKYKAWHKFW